MEKVIILFLFKGSFNFFIVSTIYTINIEGNVSSRITVCLDYLAEVKLKNIFC